MPQGSVWPRSESIDQLALNLQEDEEIKDAAEARHAELSSGDEDVEARKRPKRKHSRKPLPDHLGRQDKGLSPGEDCGDCGGSLRQISEDVTEEPKYILSRSVVRRIVRPRMVCTCCEAFAQAPLPSRPIERGIPGQAFCPTLIGKDCDPLPLHRQCEIYAHEKLDLQTETARDRTKAARQV